MRARATVIIDVGKIEANARAITGALARAHVRDVVGVTKVTCGDPRIARAMLAGGCTAVGESRLANIERLRREGVDAPMWLIRSPAPAEAADAVRLADVSLVSELATLEALDEAAAAAGRVHDVVAMVELGDLREGMMPEDLAGFIEAAEHLPHVRAIGIGASLTCYGAIRPDSANLHALGRLAVAAEEITGRTLLVSGGSSTSIEPVLSGQAPAPVGNLRVGEAIILGVDPATRLPIPGLDLAQDTLVLEVPVIECLRKPSKPMGTPTQDAFGGVPVFEDRGVRLRAICAIGRQDVPPDGIVPLDEGAQVLGASSDHLIVDVEDMQKPPHVGDSLRFRPGYAATLRLFTSPYVDKEYRS